MSSSSSGSAPRANPAIGVPQASASATTSPYGSSQHGDTTATDADPTSRASCGVVEMAQVLDAVAEQRCDALVEVAPIRPRPGQPQPGARGAGGRGSLPPGPSRARSGPTRPVRPPPGPGVQARVSTPLRTTSMPAMADPHCAAVAAETAAKCRGTAPGSRTADSSQGVGGVCRVVSNGAASADAIATGR